MKVTGKSLKLTNEEWKHPINKKWDPGNGTLLVLMALLSGEK